MLRKIRLTFAMICFVLIYNPQIQFSSKSETKRLKKELQSKTKRSKKDKRTATKMQPKLAAFLV